MFIAAGAKELVRNSDLGTERVKRPSTVAAATLAGGVHISGEEVTVLPLFDALDFEIHSVAFCSDGGDHIGVGEMVIEVGTGFDDFWTIS
jgi:hypothetical protein